MSEPDAAEPTRARLQADLRVAMKRRAAVEVAVLRALITVVDNAGAVPSRAPSETEVERRRLTAAEVHALLRGEQDARRTAAAEFERLRIAGEAARAHDEAAIIDRYLD